MAEKSTSKIALNQERTGPSRFSDGDYLTERPKVPEEFVCIRDRFENLEDVLDTINAEGVNKCGLVFGIDYTLSNKEQGQKTFDGKNLHAISDDGDNPYQEVIGILGETIQTLDDDGIIPAYGFGVKDKGIFPLQGTVRRVLKAYNEVTPAIELGGDTNFAQLIRKTIEIVKELKKYHILIIAADGQLSSEDDTIDAIVDASFYPISIVVIGVGDGPWDVMMKFDDMLPKRQFDNFQFVDFPKTKEGAERPKNAVALAALMEIPDQYRFIKELNLLLMDC